MDALSRHFKIVMGRARAQGWWALPLDVGLGPGPGQDLGPS